MQRLLVTGLFVHTELCTHIHTVVGIAGVWPSAAWGTGKPMAPGDTRTQGLPRDLPGQAALTQKFKARYLG